MSKTVQILEAAKKKVEAGWIQHTGRSDMGVCAGQALQDAWTDLINNSYPGELQDWHDAHADSTAKFMEAIHLTFIWHGFTSIPDWNDSMYREKEEVVDTFDVALKLAGKEG